MKSTLQMNQDCVLTGSESFDEDLAADSLDKVEMILFAEEEFDIDIQDEDAAEVRTVNDAVAYVEKRLLKRKS